MQLMQEKFDLVSDARVLVFEKHTDINYLTLEFQHIVQDQVSNDHEGLPSDMRLRVMKESENILSFFIEDIREPIEKVSHCYDDVGFNTEVYVRSQQLKEELNVGNTNLRGDTHEFA